MDVVSGVLGHAVYVYHLPVLLDATDFQGSGTCLLTLFVSLQPN